MTAIGAKRERIKFYRPTRAPDAHGGTPPTWSFVREVWGGIRKLSDAAAMTAGALRGNVSHSVTVRYRNDIKPGWRVLVDQGEAQFDGVVIDLSPEDNRRRGLTLTVRSLQGAPP